MPTALPSKKALISSAADGFVRGTERDCCRRCAEVTVRTYDSGTSRAACSHLRCTLHGLKVNNFDVCNQFVANEETPNA